MSQAAVQSAPAGGAAAPKLPLGKQLVALRLITQDQLEIALIEQKSRGIPLGKTLVELGFVTEAQLREALGGALGHKTLELSNRPPHAFALSLVPKSFALQHQIIPIEADATARTLTVASRNPDDVRALDQLSALLRGQYKITAVIASESEVVSAIDAHYGHELAIDHIIAEIDGGQAGAEAEGPYVRLVDAILSDAARRRASDLHFEPEAGFVRLRYRIDGVLRQVRSLHARYWPPMLGRLKIISEIDITETRKPQDGRANLTLGGRPIDFRVATQPTLHGENVVMRLLDRQRSIVPLEKMDLTAEQIDSIETMISRPEGMLLVTGPTGSGKTSTLYSVLARLNTVDVNIMTLEDPVEYPMPMLRQTDLSSGLKMDFASGVRSLLRQDPDTILVGEIRDGETATMALRAAMTGHLLLSTLHTNNALGTVVRLQEMGLPPEMLSGNLIGVIAQRLVRRLCPHCRQSFVAEDDICSALGLAPGTSLYRSVGCLRCEDMGFFGRFALMEVLRFTEEMDAAMARRAPVHELMSIARAGGFRTLADDAVRRVAMGDTTLAEAGRVVDLTRYQPPEVKAASAQAH